jgi:hypothetical protein
MIHFTVCSSFSFELAFATCDVGILAPRQHMYRSCCLFASDNLHIMMIEAQFNPLENHVTQSLLTSRIC